MPLTNQPPRTAVAAVLPKPPAPPARHRCRTARIATIATGNSVSRAVIAFATITEQQTTIATVGVGRRAISTIADQIHAGDVVDHTAAVDPTGLTTQICCPIACAGLYQTNEPNRSC